MLIILSLGVVGAAIGLFGWSRGYRRQVDLGVVSHQWIAEHRLAQTQDSHR